jgi:hypothetical protein
LAGYTGGTSHIVHRGLAVAEASKYADSGIEKGAQTRFRPIGRDRGRYIHWRIIDK